MQQRLLNYLHQHTCSNYFVAHSLWPVNGILVYFTIWTKVASVRWFVIIWLQNPSLWNFSMRVSPMWLNAVPHICGILLVLRHLASVLWMFNSIINIHNLHPIHNRSMALLFITSNNYCSLMNNLLATSMQWVVCTKTLKWIMKINSEVIGWWKSIITFTIFSTHILITLICWSLGRSNSCIDSQQHAIESVFLWSSFNHNFRRI